jgi:L-ascorbate metabolism protein UlaG (beta-lactamase superfamily)
MAPFQVKITYLFHSGFTVETANHFLIFDYYHPASQPGPAILTRDFLNTKAGVVVLVSHSHADHFDHAILKWADLENVSYICSNDIEIAKFPPRWRRLAPYQEWTLPDFKVKTFGSTDQGVSFLVNTDGLAIFHAGDLNCWRWNEDTPEEQERAKAAFQDEVARIAGNPIDIAFFPVDRRLEANYARGALHFLARLQPKLLLPMHFGKDYEATTAFAALIQNTPWRTVEITRQGQEILFEPD